jgi:hypothetical protein
MATKTKTDETETEIVETEVTEVSPIPVYLNDNKMLLEFCNRYLAGAVEIADYNTSVLKKTDNEWTQSKILAKAKELGRPEDASIEPNAAIREALVKYENIVEEFAVIKKALLETTATELGISLSNAGAERNMETETALKEKRKLTLTIATTLKTMAEMSMDSQLKDAITEFLENNPLPVVGREQVSTFVGNDAKPTPRYRVKVEVIKDGHVVLTEDGFTKAALALGKPIFGYPKNGSPNAHKLREVWEAAGNATGNTVKPVVEFEDNGLHFILTQK